ncbi:Scr1 family TA system antitoxin-like transcriptional regulator [Streptomyces rhizosphaerihabitans]|uniref:Scr1 family TA system antitoxin-like transcriptional regulator n=1 Tax=Streptomyces rhizosphaerihabitans TaxID=1266770 RepID=UPI0021C22B89|nr:Scr1 family TA system antitoxin-like transcriptional regulator [Streptomyces rhizosphaerihabitans]MCT9005582.1 Scr1 family TA system antitoxin-like transcriptional regulator [Streptomyces rhizosphaerihabitans]
MCRASCRTGRDVRVGVPDTDPQPATVESPEPERGGPAGVPVGICDELRGQRLDHVTIAVIPFASGAFHTSGQGIDYFHGPVHQLDTVQLDTDHGAELIDSPAQLECYHLVLDRVQQAALPQDKSREFITQLANDL